MFDNDIAAELFDDAATLALDDEALEALEADDESDLPPALRADGGASMSAEELDAWQSDWQSAA